jgi:hypothetical protein
VSTPPSLAPSFEPFPYASASFAWTRLLLVVHDVDAPRGHRAEGSVADLSSSVADHRIARSSITELVVRHPWPAFEIAWRDGAARRLLVHPRGLARLVPASDAARDDFARFEARVEAWVDDVAQHDPQVVITRGWLEDPIVDWTRRDALPGASRSDASYRVAVGPDPLLARGKIERSLRARVRVKLQRWRGGPRDPMPVELAISTRDIWIVDDEDRVWSIPRRALRAVYDDTKRIALVFGRNAFLAMSIVDSPIRRELLDVAYAIVDQNAALAELARDRPREL